MADKKPKSFADQFDDEEVLFVFRKHPIVMRKGLVIGSVAMLIGPLYVFALTFLRKDNLPTVGFFFGAVGVSFLLALIVFFPFWLGWYYSVFIVTDQRLIQITQRGLFHRSIVGLSLNQIQMINYEIAGLQQTLLGYGTIMVQTYVGSLTIHEVHHPAKIQKQVLEIMHGQGIDTNSSNPMLNQSEAEEA